MATNVPKSPWKICPLLPGMEIPSVTLTAKDGSEIQTKRGCTSETSRPRFLSRKLVTILSKAVGSTARNRVADRSGGFSVGGNRARDGRQNEGK
jgi:hypothetical protein